MIQLLWKLQQGIRHDCQELQHFLIWLLITDILEDLLKQWQGDVCYRHKIIRRSIGMIIANISLGRIHSYRCRSDCK